MDRAYSRSSLANLSDQGEDGWQVQRAIDDCQPYFERGRVFDRSSQAGIQLNPVHAFSTDARPVNMRAIRRL